MNAGTFDVDDYASELAAPTSNVGTRLLLENERVRIWEIALAPGERAPFHKHAHPYLFVCVQAGRTRTRFPNGHFVEDDSEAGEAFFSEHSEADPGIHDLENVGSTPIRFTTVELLG